MGFAGEDFPRAYFTSLIGRTVDVEATRKLKAEKTAAASAAAGAASPPRVGGGKGKSPATLKWRERWPQSHGTAAAAARASSNATASSLVGGRADGDGSAGRGTGNGDGRGGGDEDGDVVFRWHVDSLLSGGENMEVVPLMEEGFVTNWDLLERVWEHAEQSRLKVKLSDHPVLLSEKSFNTSRSRLKYTEIMFEKFGVPAEFISKDAVLACFSIGRTTATLTDVGGDTSVVTPVVDGWVESKGIVKSLLGSNALQRYYLHLLQQARGGVPIPPLSAAKAKSLGNNLRPSLAERLRMDVARDMMVLAARASDAAFEENAPQFSSIPSVPFRLPDGTEVGIGTDRFKVPELLVNTSPLTNALQASGESCPPALRALAKSLDRPGFVLRPLQASIVQAVMACEREQQPSLMNGVVLAGGGCCFEGLPERVKAEIEGCLDSPSSSWRVKVLAAGVNERKVSTWLGGSILGSLGSFHEMWLSKAEYEEHGAQMIDKKCP
ncbi:unnamed protein product [Ascophyllum nodosum]